MKFWKLGGAGANEPQGRGFEEGLRALEERRYQEMGRMWQRVPERFRRAEARRRARNEMARRIGRHIDKPPLSETTIARRGRRDEAPPGVDKTWLDRWAAIDRAGGIANLAQQLGTTPSRVRRWRDDPSAETPKPRAAVVVGAPLQPVGVACTGFVIINGEEYKKDIPDSAAADVAVVEVEPAGAVMQAWLSNDIAALHEALGAEIAMQVVVARWNLPGTYVVDYRIEKLLQFSPI